MNEEPEKALPRLPAIISGDLPAKEGPTKSERLQQKMAALRLHHVMNDLHTQASTPGTPEDEAVAAASELGRVCLKHWELIIWSLRVAGGARRP